MRTIALLAVVVAAAAIAYGLGSRRGADATSGSSDLSGRPRGTPWDDEQVEQLIQRYPRLADRFR